MEPELFVVQGDTAPSFFKQLLDQNNAAPDLTGKTVTCTVKPEDGCRRASTTTATVVDARGGYVRHDWVAAETQSPGLLLVSFNDGSVTYPADGWYHVRVTPKLT